MPRPTGLTQHDPSLADIEVARGGAEQQLHVVLRVPPGRPERELVRLASVGEYRLGERGPVVWGAGLLAEHDDPSVEPEAAQGLTAALRGEPATGDQHVGVGASHGRLLAPAPRARARAGCVASGVAARFAGACAALQDAQHGQVDDRDRGQQHERAQPLRRGVAARAERVDDAEHPHEHGGAVQLAPQLHADPPPRVEAQAEQRREIAGEDAEAGEQWAGSTSRTGPSGLPDPGRSQGSPSSASPCTAIAREPDERDVLVQAHERAAHAGAAQQLRGHRQPEQHRDGDEAERDDARGAADQPPQVRRGVVRAPSRGPSRELRARRAARSSGPISSTSPSSWTTSPPYSASTRRAPSGPSSRAILESVSASRALGASAVTPISPVHAGRPVAGSSRWWAKRPVRVLPDAHVQPRGRDAAGADPHACGSSRR